MRGEKAEKIIIRCSKATKKRFYAFKVDNDMADNEEALIYLLDHFKPITFVV